MDCLLLKLTFEVLALIVIVFGDRRAKSKQDHKYGTVICQDWGVVALKKNEEKCIVCMHTHWGKPCGVVP